MLARSRDALDDAERALIEMGSPEVLALSADLTDAAAVEDAFAEIMTEDFGHPAHLGRAGDPAEIGPVIAFLASRINTYMAGANVNVDGGSDFT